MSAKDESLSFELDGRRFSQFSLVGRRSGRTMSKVGLLSWSAMMDGQPVKIYECHNEAQAGFIETISNRSRLKEFFPACIMRRGVYLVTEWVAGKAFAWRAAKRDAQLLRQVAGLQAAVHAQTSGEDSRPFEYAGYLKQRLQRFKGILPIDDAVERIHQTLDADSPPPGARLSHPDLTAVNLILEDATNAPKIIDNELLSANEYYLIDLFNTHRSFGSKLSGELLEPYLAAYMAAGGDARPIAAHAEFFYALWSLRVVGSMLQAGSLGNAFHYARGFDAREADAHPLIRLVKEKYL